MPASKKFLVVGAGFSGATIARELAEAGHHVDIIDKRLHLAGNAYDETNRLGIRVHKYGPHLFHTNEKQVVDYLGRFTEWLPYQHKVKAMWNGQLVTFPINANSKSTIHAWDKLNNPPSKENGYVQKWTDVIEEFYGRYTRKMWGIKPEDLDPSILARVPMRDDFEPRYFPKDKYQFLPKDGYTELVTRMLTHDNILWGLGFNHRKEDEKDYVHVFNSMPIDEYYDFQFGELPYRSIRFHTVDLPAPQLYGHPVVNFTHEGPMTRVTEWKLLPGHGSHESSTTVTFEQPCDYRDNAMERYYPVKDLKGENRATYEKYKAIPNDKVTFIGRTGLYAYLDMHQAVNISLQTAKKFLADL